ncbi:hypothetical protein [Pusillimonas noertemannii]|uniref:Capsular polysaccharide biosynthesis protein n=1 Tax=Pusillimonas noertemannii TaxID=305977 RepID=A0A2U1CRX2_9BURK|nr:hypothetical protein [Pusillimonas noertemannii]NYT67971.1 hypothetical protein [Pusillimonas noertemannii]PVY68645.1 hypothetical protein C7440_1056 [Pusillimonas noertemannii]TFL11888.1 hypothetical protein CSC72_01795 [Pusillimonas noertemannii]
MRVGIYSGVRNVAALALGEGFSLVGAEVSHRNVQYYRGERERFDLVVTLALREGRAVLEQYSGACPVLVADWGYLARVSHPGESATGHWQVSLGGLNKIPTFACPPDRFDVLGLDLVERGGDPDGYALICGQVPGDAAHGMDAAALKAWLLEAVAKHGNVVYRPHPRGGIDLPGVKTQRGSLAEALAGARLVVTFNSNVGHDALIAGVPVLCGPGAAYDELAGEVLPSIQARRDYFSRVAYGQWTLAEMRSGACQRFIFEHLLTGVGPAIGSPSSDDAESSPTVDSGVAPAVAAPKRRGRKPKVAA